MATQADTGVTNLQLPVIPAGRMVTETRIDGPGGGCSAPEPSPVVPPRPSGMLSRLLCRVLSAVYDRSLGTFPPKVRIETTNACNAKCIICPHHKMTRTVKRMDAELYHRVIDESAEYGCEEVHLHNFGEPFLDKRLEEFVAYAKDAGIAKVKIFSNGSIISTDRARGVLEAGIDEIKVSFDGATKEEFEKIRYPLKFDDVVNNMVELVRVRDEMGSDARIYVACCSTSDKSQTMAMLESKVDGFSFGKIHNWGSEDYETSKTKLRKPCRRVWETLTVLSNGDVSLCCLDYDGSVLLGNVNEQSIHEIWRSDKYRRVRDAHRKAAQQQIALCGSCSKSYL